jgi:chorismate dehydratase
MLRLGNIDYSNCYPIHGPVLEDRPPWLAVTDGSPSDLNRRLAQGGLDVAPCSSIELARHSREYSVLRGLCIGSDGPVDSIVLVSRVPVRELDGREVALPTASAASRCLLRILLEVHLEIAPRWLDFDQAMQEPVRTATAGPGEPKDLSGTADAALFIGDTALRRPPRDGEVRTDLGAAWTSWTGLPFVYALWLARSEVAGREELRELHRLLITRRDAVEATAVELADGASERYGFEPDRLRAYWGRIRYDLDDRMLRGLQRFLELAHQIGEPPPPREIRFAP